MRGTILLALGLLGACGNNRGAAEQMLRDEGHHDIVLTEAAGGGFDFTSRRGGDRCRGSITVSSGFGRSSSSRSSRCGPGVEVELAQQDCAAGQIDACARAGESAIELDPTTARTLLERACTAGRGPSCHQAAGLHASGRGGPESAPRALVLYSRACDLGEARGCLEQGVLLYHGRSRGVPQDRVAAERASRRGCEGGNALACKNLGFILEEKTPPDPVGACAAFQRSCEGGEAATCGTLGVRVDNGRCGREEDPAAARTWFRRACDGEHVESCGNLGLLLGNGRGGPADVPAALELMRSACDREDAQSCRRLARRHHDGDGVQRDVPRAHELWQRGCDFGDGQACNSLGVRYYEGEDGLARDAARAMALFRKGCEARDLDACNNVAVGIRDAGGPAEEVRTFYQRACDLGHRRACEAARR